ncbi:hypothetical protein D770_20255 [Flammeovirgaceae bacterium 311]|nr:hypothetical protein D770_20255 [Flammeovirgaceae bacterium 311]
MRAFINSLFRGVQLSGIPPRQSLYLTEEGRLSEWKPVSSPFSTVNGLVYNRVNGHHYFSAQSIGGIPWNRSSFVYRYDKSGNQIVQQVHIPKHNDITEAWDTHPVPVTHVLEDGNILVTVEKTMDSNNRSNGHNTDMLLYKTTVPGDLSTLAYWKSLPGFYCYPKVWQKGPYIHFNFRGTRGGLDLTKTILESSYDSGVTFTDRIIVDIPMTSPLRRAYTRMLWDESSEEMILLLTIRNDSIGIYESVYAIRSHISDGKVWQNWEGTFSKDVSTQGAITFAEIQPCLVWYNNPEQYITLAEGGAAANGTLKLLMSRSIPTGGVFDNNAESTQEDLRLFFNDGSGWKWNSLKSIMPSPSYAHYTSQENLISFASLPDADYIQVMDKTNSPVCRLYEHRSTNNFQSYTSKLIWEGVGSYYLGPKTANARSIKEQLSLLVDVQGQQTQFNSSSNLLVLDA